MAETLLKQTSSRTGYRDHLTKTLNKARDFMEKEEPTEIDVVSINSIIEQLTMRKSILQELDQKFVALLEEPEDIEQEFFDTEEIRDEILETFNQISKFIHLTLSHKKSTQPLSPAIDHEFPLAVSNESSLVQSNPSNPSSSETQEIAPSTYQAASGGTSNTLQNSDSPLNTQSPPLIPQSNTNFLS